MTQLQPVNTSAPIGLFDSGVGGLSVYLHLARQLPDECYLYYADTLNVPYGVRSSAEIQQFTLQAVDWLYQRGCKLVVIACNSASAHALEAARRRYPALPIVGLVPALKPAVLASRSKHVAVLATKATLEGALLNQVINDIAIPRRTAVSKYFDPDLVPWVEAGMPQSHATAQHLLEYLTELHTQGVDHLVLGCTHYPFFRPLLEAKIAKDQLQMTVVDSGAAIAARVQQLLMANQLNHHLTNQTGHQIDHKGLAAVDANTGVTLEPIDDVHTATAPLIIPLSFYASRYEPKLGALVQSLVAQPVRLLNTL